MTASLGDTSIMRKKEGTSAAAALVTSALLSTASKAVPHMPPAGLRIQNALRYVTLRYNTIQYMLHPTKTGNPIRSQREAHRGESTAQYMLMYTRNLSQPVDVVTTQVGCCRHAVCAVRRHTDFAAHNMAAVVTAGPGAEKMTAPQH
jgi:hypothetical protein